MRSLEPSVKMIQLYTFVQLSLFLVAWSFTGTAHASRELFWKLKLNNGDGNKSGGFRKSPMGLGGLRPVSSDHLPIEPLIEDPNSRFDPKPSDINVKKLRAQIGADFDRKFMSIKDPRRRRNKSLTKLTRPPSLSTRNHRKNGHKGSRRGRKRPSFLKLLRTARLQDGTKIKLDVSKRERRKFQKYMWSLTFCPVRFTWRQLSARFWPRWFREGTCVNRRSCSVPEGMTCQPSQFTYKTFLRWVCKSGRNKSCEWVNISYPIITECSCQCPDGS